MSQLEDIILRNTRKNRYTKKTWAEFDEHQLNQLNAEVDTMVKRITKLESVADNQIWPSLHNGFSTDYVRGYEQATHDIARKLKGGDV